MDPSLLRGLRTRFSRIARIPLRALMPVALLVAVGLGGCSVVHVNGSMRTTERTICVVEPGLVEPEVHEVLLELLKKKRFDVLTLPRDAAPGACRLTLVYSWRKEQYYLPALVKQFAISLDLYVDGEKYANASFDLAPRQVPTVFPLPRAGARSTLPGSARDRGVIGAWLACLPRSNFLRKRRVRP